MAISTAASKQPAARGARAARRARGAPAIARGARRCYALSAAAGARCASAFRARQRAMPPCHSAAAVAAEAPALPAPKRAPQR